MSTAAGAVGAPSRVLLSVAAAELAATVAGVRLPHVAGERRWPATQEDGPAGSVADPHAELVRSGLALPGTGGVPVLTDGLAAALALLGRPEAVVDLTLVRAIGPPGRVTSWQARAGRRVTTVTAAGPGQVELAWFGVDHWADELARAVRLPPVDIQARRSGTELPYSLVVAAGAALRGGRDDLLAELVAGEVGLPGATAPLLRRLHTSARGRLLAAVAGPAARRCGVLSWVLLPDGWWALEPHAPRRGDPWVSVRPVGPERLGEQVALLCWAVAS